MLVRVVLLDVDVRFVVVVLDVWVVLTDSVEEEEVVRVVDVLGLGDVSWKNVTAVTDAVTMMTATTTARTR